MAARSRRDGRRRPGAHNILRRQLGRALAKLGDDAPLRDVSVHEARKELKRARSTLRLLRDAIGDAAYRSANRELRDGARPLSRVRNAKALLDVVAKLRASTQDRSSRSELGSIERQLRRERRRARSDLLSRPSDLGEVRRSIRAVLAKSESWPAANADSLCRGIERIYRKGRKAHARADADPSDEALHESRKQTKYLGKALELLEPSQHGPIAKRVKRTDAIADALGDDHDLALLQKKLARARSGPGGRKLAARIERRRTKLQREAGKKSRRLYKRKAKAFVEALDLSETRS